MKRYFFTILILFSSTYTQSQSRIKFVIDKISNESFTNVGIRGNIAPLSWEKSIQLKKNGTEYSTIIEFDQTDKELEFKFVQYNDDNAPNWEGIQNRTLLLTQDTLFTSTNSWNQEQVIDIHKIKPISSEDLMNDYELIKTMVLDVHPGTYRYNSKEEIESALHELKLKLKKPLSHGEAYLAFSKLTAQLKCDHTKPGFTNQKKIINSVIHYQKDKLPFTFKWINEQMVVIHNASNNQSLKRGTIVLSINDIPVSEIRNQLLPFVGADGATDGNRLFKLEVDGYDFRYNAFDIFYPLVFPIDSSIKLDIQEFQKDEYKTIEVQPLTRVDRAELLMEKYDDFPKSRDDLWQLKILNDSTALLTINSFGLYGWKAMKLDYKEYLKKSFAQLNDDSISHLIIDIRKNVGGNDEMANELFSYLAEYNYNFEREGRTRYLNFPETLKPYVKTWGDNPWYYNLEPKNKKPEDGYYSFKENFAQPLKRSDKKIYTGNSYLLTSAANTSLAFYTAYRFKLQKLGLIIGQQTGGNLNDINGGQILFLELPNSKIEIDFPVMGGFTLVPQRDKGIEPNLVIKYTIEDIIKNRDLEIESILKIIKEKKARYKTK